MANMPTPNQLLAAARATGFPVVEMAGWRGRCRCHNGNHERGERPAGRAFGPWHGTMVHQTAGPRLTGAKAEQYVQNILIGGNGHVPGPLCQYGVGGDGTIYMVAAGRCNHAGRISQAGLNAMRNGSFSLTGNHNLRGSGIDGNRYTIGMELLMNGATLRDTQADPQRSAAVALSAELSRLAKRSGRETHGHGEVSIDRGFTDPGYDMGRFRTDVMAHVKSPTSIGAGAPTNTPKSDFERLMDMYKDKAEFESAIRKNSYDGVWGPWADQPYGSRGNDLNMLHHKVNQIAQKVGLPPIDTSDLAKQVAAELADDVRAAVLEAGADEATAQRAAVIIGERVLGVANHDEKEG